MSTLDRDSRRILISHPRAQGPEGPIFKPPSWEWAESGEFGWWVRPDWRDILLSKEGASRLEEWREMGIVETIKSGPHRIVSKVNLPTGAIYVKEFLVPTWREVLRQWLRRGKGRNEGKRASKLAAIGIPTIRPVGLGERRIRRFLFENTLISPEIALAIPLDQVLRDTLPSLPPRRAAIIRRHLAEALGTLTARMHSAGMKHDDFHPGNLLVRLDEGDKPWLAMIDLDALRLGKPLNTRAAAGNLARLNHASLLLVTKTDRHRFLRAYVDSRGKEIGSIERFTRRIAALTSRWAERLWRRRAKRCLGANADFEAMRGKNWWALASRSISRELLEHLGNDPDGPFSDPGSVLLKHSRTTTVVEFTIPVDGDPTKVVYKRFNRKKRMEAYLSAIRPSRAWRAWRANHHLRSRGLPTPPDLLVLGKHDRLGPIPLPLGPTETYLMTVKAEPSITLSDYLISSLPERPEADRMRLRRRLADSLGKLLRDLHDRNLSDRDLKASNLLIEGCPEASRPRLSLIDLVGVRLISPLPQDRKVQNLARLLASLSEHPEWSRTDSLRLLLAYLPLHEGAAGRWKGTWRQIARRIDRKRATNAKRGRPLS